MKEYTERCVDCGTIADHKIKVGMLARPYCAECSFDRQAIFRAQKVSFSVQEISQ